MGLFTLLFNRIYVLTLRFRAEGQVFAEIRLMGFRGNMPEVLEYIPDVQLSSYFRKKPKFPVCMMITGAGVARKTMEVHSPLAERIRGSEEFLWNEKITGDLTEMTFVRKQQLNFLTETGAMEIVMTQAVADVPGEEGGVADAGRAMECALCFRKQKLSVKDCLAPGAAVDRLAGIACRRLLLPVLLLWLSVLMVNYIVFDRLYEQNGQKKIRLAALERQAGVRDETLRRTGRLVQELDAAGERAYARILDRIAAQVPSGVRLSLLEIEPCRRDPEAGKPLETLAGLICLEGETAQSGEVSVFSELLSRQDFVRGVVLTSLDRNVETGKFYFKMEVRL